jgi:alkylation response protein AidB-like acyl-CoA dehydrogenase
VKLQRGDVQTENLGAFRKELREFFRTNIPEDIREKVSAGHPLLRQDFVRSQQILNANRLAVPHWPRQWGGQEWTPLHVCIYVDELQRAAVPLPLQFNCNMVGPVIIAFGTEEQKARFLPAAANLDNWWCQGFSEPDAGSDLASLRTRATRTADGYRVTGQKTWTTYAQYADWIFCLVRTSTEGKKQEGISFVLIKMDSPGITVRPIVTVDGRHEVNEVFFDDVLVPFENLVGEENKGWTYAKFLLANERSGIARIGLSKERIDRVRRLAKQAPFGTGTLWDFAPFRARVVGVELELKSLELTQMRIMSETVGEGKPSPLSSILKLKGTQLQQAATELLMEVAGPDALRSPVDVADPHTPFSEENGPALAMSTYMNFRKVSIYGGSNEIQRNIIAKTVLGL